MAAMSTENLAPETETPEIPEAETEQSVIAATIIFEDGSIAPLPIRDPKSASLIFKPSGQGCFP